MSDQPKSSPTKRDEQPMFRDMTLAMAPPAEAATLRAVGDMLFTYLLECADTNFKWAPQLLGLAADLEAAALLLDSYLQEHSLPALRRSHPAVGWGRRLREIAAEVRTAVEDDEHNEE